MKTTEQTVSPIAEPSEIGEVQAYAKPGYHFVNWTIKNAQGQYQQVGDKELFKPQKNIYGEFEDQTYYANFAEDNDVIIQYKVKNNVGGTITKDIETGGPATGQFSGSRATALNGYHFEG